MRKKLLTVAMTATMALACAGMAFAAEPVASYDFSDGTGIRTEGSAQITANPDDAKDKVLCVDKTAGGKNGNFALVSEGFLSDYDFSNGVTVSMNVRPTVNSSDWNYVFCLGASGTGGSTGKEYLYCDGTIGFITRHGDPHAVHFPHEGWTAENNVSSAYDYFMKEENCNQWYKLTYVYGKDSIAMYVDGVKACQWTLATGAMDAIFASISKDAALVLGAGASRGTNENFGGYIDDVMIYASALTADEVAAIPAKVPAKVEEETTTVKNPSAGPDSEVESTTAKNPSAGPDSEVETTTKKEETTTEKEETTTTKKEEETTAKSDVAEVIVVTEEMAAEIAKDVVANGGVTGDVPENAELKVNVVSKDTDGYKAAVEFAQKTLKANAAIVLDLTLEVNGTKVQPLNNGKVGITMTADKLGLGDAEWVSVLRYDETAKKMVEIATVQVKDGKFTFETNHFSTYLFASAKAPSTGDGKVDANGKTGDTAPIIPLAAAATAALGAVVVASSKKKNA